VSGFSPAVKAQFWHEIFGSPLCVLKFFISQLVLCFPSSDPLYVLCFCPVLDQRAGRCCSLPVCSSPSVPALILLVDLPVSTVLALSFILIPTGLCLIRSGLSFRLGASPLSWSCLLIPMFMRLVCCLVVIPW
jgi:hypothetical protein